MKHVADTLRSSKKLIFTAQSAKNFHQRMLICRYVFEKGHVLLNPFNMFGYYLYELVPRNAVREGNNNVLSRCDELWVFGDLSDGVLSEIRYADELKMPIRYFSIANLPDQISEVTFADLPKE